MALVAALVAAFSLHSGPAPSSAATADTTVIVKGGPAAQRAITRAGGTVDKNLKPLGMIIARVPRDSIASLRKAPGVGSVVPDGTVKLLDDSTAPPAPVSTSLSDVRTAVADNGDGAGVDIALIDSGIVPVASVGVVGPDFSSDAGDSALRGLDSFGHGTHIAGIMTGNDSGNGFQGVAPAARTISLKVAATDGSTSLGRILSAMTWAVVHKSDEGRNIRVMNLSLGFRPESAYVNDVLSYAVEQVWKYGITVVASAGNAGATSTGLDSPAYDPFVIAVGADDLSGTPSVADDAVPAWSSKGADGRNPDVVAPGRAIVSLRVPGSYLDVNHPGGRISDTLFRGSGTSQAAAVVSGAAAVLIAKRPSLTPDQVKYLLTSTADQIPGVDPSAQGAGRIDVAAATAAAPNNGKQGFAPANFPSDYLKSLQGDKRGKNPAISANGSIWSGSIWSGSLWSGSIWNGSLWSGSLWSGSLWSTYTDPDA